MNDESIMPFGKYKGETMIEVPDSYLLWIWNKNKTEYKETDGFGLSPDTLAVMEYIEDCFAASDLI